MIMKLNIVCSSICSVCSHYCLFQACRPITRLHAWIGQINKSSNIFLPLHPFVVFPVLPLLTFIFSVFCYTSREFFLASSVLPACKLPDVHRSLDTVWLKHLGMNFSYANMCYHVIYMWSEPPDYVKQKHNNNYNVTTVNGHTIFTLFNKWPQDLHFVHEWPQYLHFVQ